VAKKIYQMRAREVSSSFTQLSSSVLRSSVSRYLGLSFVLSLLCACPPPPPSNARDDLTKYLEEARQWTETEAQINNAIIAVRRDQFVNDDLTVKTLKPIIDVTQTYVQKLESYHPQAKPLQNVHQEYIEAWRAHQFAIAAIVNCVEKKDYIQLAKANTDLTEAQQSVSAALSDLARLLQEAGLRSPTASPNQSPSARPQSPSGLSGLPQGE
jgi:hypothetical protein